MSLGITPASWPETHVFPNVELSADQQVPPVDSDGSGILHAVYDDDSNTLLYTVAYQLDRAPSAPTGARLEGDAGEVQIELEDLDRPTEHMFSGQVELSDEQEAMLLRGRMSLSLMSEDFEEGELRGQLIEAPITHSFSELDLEWSGDADPDAEPPEGHVWAGYDRRALRLTIGAAWDELTSPLTRIEVRGPSLPGEPGRLQAEVVRPGLEPITGARVFSLDLDEADQRALLDGLWQVVLVTRANPEGELSARLIDDAAVQAFPNVALTFPEDSPIFRSDAEGRMSAVYNEVTGALRWQIDYRLDVSSASLETVRIHAPGDRTFELGRALPPHGRLSGTLTLSHREAQSLLGGEWRVVLHSDQFPEGELTGALENGDITHTFTCRILDARQTVPPAPRTVHAVVDAVFDEGTGTLTCAASWPGAAREAGSEVVLRGPAPPGYNGPAQFSAPLGGRRIGDTAVITAELDEDQSSSLLRGEWCVTVITPRHPNGAVRAQLIEDQFPPGPISLAYRRHLLGEEPCLPLRDASLSPVMDLNGDAIVDAADLVSNLAANR